MTDFRQRLCDFMTECKNDALLELGENNTYAACRERISALYNRLYTLMTPDCLEAFKQYQETMSAVSGMETDYCYMCGIRDYLAIGEEFGAPGKAGWNEFVAYMLPDKPGDGAIPRSFS